MIHLARIRSGRALTLAIAFGQTVALGACATRSQVPLPALADYNNSCAEIVAEFQRADAAAADRKAMGRRADISLGTSAVVLAATVAAPTGIAIPIAAIAIQQSRSDFGYMKFTEQREHFQSLAVRNGCAQELAELKPPAQHEPTERRTIEHTGAVPFVLGSF